MNTWKHCSVHGPGDENSWGCPECVRELRKAVAERDARIAELEKALGYYTDSRVVTNWGQQEDEDDGLVARKALGKGER